LPCRSLGEGWFCLGIQLETVTGDWYRVTDFTIKTQPHALRPAPAWLSFYPAEKKVSKENAIFCLLFFGACKKSKASGGTRPAGFD
jgi:hypothetical protein